MKALLWKDICLLRRQLRLFIFAMLVFAAIPNSYIQLFAVAYASMLPYNTIALDEQSHWDQLAAMMPYSDRDVVLTKYIVGWGGCLAVGALALAARAGARPVITPAAVSWCRAPCPGCAASALQRGGLWSSSWSCSSAAVRVPHPACSPTRTASGSPAAHCC